MTAFTTVNSSMDPLSAAIANEISNGVRERVQVTAGTPPALAAADGDAHGAAYWANLQTLIESICTSYYDSAPGAGGYAGESTIAAFTLATFRAAAGLHSSGFRRATAWDPATDDWTDLNDPMYSYGTIQAGDIFGPWIYVDLQNALKALLWTRLSTGREDSQARGGAGLGDSYTCAEALPLLQADYAAGWSAYSEVYPYWVSASLYATGGGAYNGSDNRSKALLNSTDAKLSVLPQAIDCYGLFVFTLDFDTTGYTSGQYTMLETMASDDAVKRVAAAWVGAYDGDPLTIAGASCPNGVSKDFAMTDVCWIARWGFTHL